MDPLRTTRSLVHLVGSVGYSRSVPEGCECLSYGELVVSRQLEKSSCSLLARHSSASALPTSVARSTSKDEPRPVEHGKQLEGVPLKTTSARGSVHMGATSTEDASYIGYHAHRWDLNRRDQDVPKLVFQARATYHRSSSLQECCSLGETRCATLPESHSLGLMIRHHEFKHLLPRTTA